MSLCPAPLFINDVGLDSGTLGGTGGTNEWLRAKGKGGKGMDDGATNRQVIEVSAWVTPEGMAARYRPTDADGAPPPRQRPLQRDPLVLLFAEGQLKRHHVQAGLEIARVFRAVTLGVSGHTTAGYGERLDRGADAELPEMLRIALVSRYAPWRRWAGEIAATPARSLADLTLLVCVDGLGPRQAADVLRMDHRTVKRRLQVSLHWYALHAGWLAPKDA